MGRLLEGRCRPRDGIHNVGNGRPRDWRRIVDATNV